MLALPPAEGDQPGGLWKTESREGVSAPNPTQTPQSVSQHFNGGVVAKYGRLSPTGPTMEASSISLVHALRVE